MPTIAWLALSLPAAAAIERQATEAVRAAQAARGSAAREALHAAMAQRVDDLERFYAEHDVDPRAMKIEAARVRLKRHLLDVGHRPRTPATKTPAPEKDTPRTPRSVAVDPRPPPTRPIDDVGGSSVVVRVTLSAEEFEELRTRRAALESLRLAEVEGKAQGRTNVRMK